MAEKLPQCENCDETFIRAESDTTDSRYCSQDCCAEAKDKADQFGDFEFVLDRDHTMDF